MLDPVHHRTRGIHLSKKKGIFTSEEKGETLGISLLGTPLSRGLGGA